MVNKFDGYEISYRALCHKKNGYTCSNGRLDGQTKYSSVMKIPNVNIRGTIKQWLPVL